jgi:hypothetical protein
MYFPAGTSTQLPPTCSADVQAPSTVMQQCLHFNHYSEVLRPRMLPAATHVLGPSTHHIAVNHESKCKQDIAFVGRLRVQLE